MEDSENYGLSQLYQIKGRVGRGNKQSYCVLFYDVITPNSKKRMEILKNSNDGFYIASEDLKLRGPGEILGQAQSGDMRFSIGDIYSDSDILASAKDCCEYIKSDDFKPDDDEIIRFRKHMEDYRDKTLTNLNL